MKLGYKYIIAIVYAVVLFLDRLDLTIVNITLPTLAKYFGISIIATDWVNLAFLLALAVSIPVSTWLGDRFGFKRMFIIAMLLFGLGSTLCAITVRFEQLIILRFIQGIGGGMLIPIGMTLVYRVYDKSEYASITSFTFLPSLIAPAIAPFLGGVLLDIFGWRTVFLFSGPICLVLAVFSMIMLQEEPHKVKYPLDKMGFVLSSVVLLDIFYNLAKISRNGFSIYTVLLTAILIPLIWGFIKIENQHKHPLIDLSFFKNGLFVRANLIQLCFQSCHFGAIFLIGLFLQTGIGFSAILAGLMMGMQAVGAMLVSRFSVRLFNRYGPKLPIMIGFTGIAVISPMILLINKLDMLIVGILLFLIRGVFSGLCGTPIQTISVLGFEKKEIGSINSIFNACRQISISFGVAVSSLLIALGLHLVGIGGTSNIPVNKTLEVFGYGFWAITVIAIIGFIITSSIQKVVFTLPQKRFHF